MDTYLLIALVVLLVIFIGFCCLGENTTSLFEGFAPANSTMMYSRSGKNAKITDITSKITVTAASSSNGSSAVKTDYVASAAPSNGTQTFTSTSSGTAVYNITAKTITITNGSTTTIYTNTGSGTAGTFTAPNGDTAVLSTTSTITVNPGNILYTSTEAALDPSNRYDVQNYTSSGNGTGFLAYVTGKPVFSVTDINGTITVFSTNLTPNNDNNDNNNDNNNNNNRSRSNSYDNYNHYTGSSYPSIFYGPDGGTARIIQTGTDATVVVTNKNGTTDIYYISNGQVQKKSTTQAFVGPNGNTASITTGSNGKQVLKITTSSGSVIVYNSDNTYHYQSQDQDMNQYDSSTNKNGSNYTTAFTTSSVTGPNGGTAGSVTGPGGNTAYYANGISGSMIPPGQEDMYILKSQIVPPVCPSCPQPLVKCDGNSSDNSSSNSSSNTTGQIPYEYKQVPDYSAMSANQMPMPVLNDFSTFGM